MVQSGHFPAALFDADLVVDTIPKLFSYREGASLKIALHPEVNNFVARLSQRYAVVLGSLTV